MPGGETGTLRLLPARDGSGAMSVELMVYSARPDSEPPTSVNYIIAADGGTIQREADWSGKPTLAQSRNDASGPLAAGWSRASWQAHDRSISITLEGDGERQLVFQQIRFGPGEMIISKFKGQRDGCD